MIESFMNKSEENLEVRAESRAKKAGIIIAAVFLSVLMFAAAGCTGGGSDVSDNVLPPPAAPASDNVDANAVSGDDVMVEPGTADMSNKPAAPDAAAKGSEKDVVGEALPGESEKMVAMTVEDSGRANPFLPLNEVKKDETKQAFDLQKAKLQYDLVDPPNAAQMNSDAEKVLTTKVSGVMYDTQSPSAILNIEGSDYLVRSGDVINGYKVLAISPSVVTVQLGTNVYKAGVGELLATDGIQYNTVSNLDKKFGGAKK